MSECYITINFIVDNEHDALVFKDIVSDLIMKAAFNRLTHAVMLANQVKLRDS